MLSIFPELFTYSLVAPFILRIALGAYFIYHGIRHHKEDKMLWDSVWNNKRIGKWTLGEVLAKIQLVLGAMFILGLWTQIAAILAIVFNKVEWHKRHGLTARPTAELWAKIFLSAMAFALLFLGAGFMAIDLPL